MSLLSNIFKQNLFLKNIAKLFSANFLVQIIAFGLSPIITRLYDPSDFGILAVFMSIAGFFIVIANFRFDLAIILPKKDDEANALIVLSLFISLVVSLISFLVVYFFQKELSLYFSSNYISSWLFLIPLFVFFSSLFSILINYHNRLKKYNKQVLGQSVLGLSNPLISIFLTVKNNFSFGLIRSVLIANIFASIILAPIFLKNKVFKTSVSLKFVFKKYINFPLYNMPHALLNFISNSLPVIVLTSAFGSFYVGLFTMAVGKVFKPINLLGNSIYQVLSKKTVDNLNNEMPILLEVKKTLKILILIGIIPFLTLFIFAQQIFPFIWGAQWLESGRIIQYLLPWLFMVYLVSPFSFLPNVLNKQKGALLIEIFHFILRFIALSIGVYYDNIFISIGLFSLVGTIMLIFTLFWYLKILKQKKQ